VKLKKITSTTSFNDEATHRFLERMAGPLQQIEQRLGLECSSFDPNVAACASYVTAAQGKRMRPALVFYSAAACSGRPPEDHSDQEQHEALLKAGLIVELVHIATLVHDDILDGATFRRSRLTAAAKWGPEISVLLGDCLFAHALKLAADYPTPFVCRRVSEATNTVCSGEILQTQRRFDLKLARDEYVKIIGMKTGALFAVSCELGAFLAGSSPERLERLRQFGDLFGIAYQIYDDIVDLIGNEAETGKSLGTDLQKGKLTLPLLLLLEQVENGDQQVVSSLLLNEHDNTRGMLMDYVRAHKTVEQSAKIALDFARRAMDQLAELPQNEGAELLRGMTSLLISRLEEDL
jgi:octaprenyl-diphosphate synthase